MFCSYIHRIWKSKCHMQTPNEIRQRLATIRAHSGNTSQLRTNDVLWICSVVERLLPKPHPKGKECPGCGFRMHNRKIHCPNCNRQTYIQHPYVRQKVKPPSAPPLHANDCVTCGNDIRENEGYTIDECGCTYHISCLADWGKSSTRCCVHADKHIPQDFVRKYIHY